MDRSSAPATSAAIAASGSIPPSSCCCWWPVAWSIAWFVIRNRATELLDGWLAAEARAGGNGPAPIGTSAAIRSAS